MSIPEIQVGFQIGPVQITNTMVWTWFIMLILIVVFLVLGHGATLRPTKTKQVVAEFIVDTINNMTSETMGAKNIGFAPYMLSLFAFLLLSNVSGFLFLGFVRPPTADWATTLALALLSFFLIQGNGIKSQGGWGYFKSLFDPIPLLFPINVISEFAPIVSLSFRLFGNILGGLIITSLFYSLYTGSTTVTAWAIIAGIVLIVLIAKDFLNKRNSLSKGAKKLVTLIGVLCLLPILATSLVHFYFDLFAGILQAYIFMMLTMVFISNKIVE